MTIDRHDLESALLDSREDVVRLVTDAERRHWRFGEYSHPMVMFRCPIDCVGEHSFRVDVQPVAVDYIPRVRSKLQAYPCWSEEDGDYD